MGVHVIKPTSFTEIAGEVRLRSWFGKHRESRKPIYYLLPSNKWLHTARQRQPGLLCKTFDDLAELILQAKAEQTKGGKRSFIPCRRANGAISFSKSTDPS